MRRTLTNLAAFALGLALPLLMAQVGGFPSRPRFQTVLVGTGAAPTQQGALTGRGDVNSAIDFTVDNDNNGTANQARFQAVSGDVAFSHTATGSGNTAANVINGPVGGQGVLRTLGNFPLVFGTNNTLAATISGAQVMDFVNAPTVVSVAVATTQTGTYTGTVTGCTTADTQTIEYTKTGGLVNIAISAFLCTSNTAFYTITGAPVAIQPAGAGTGSGEVSVYNFVNNGVAEFGTVSIAMLDTGVLEFRRNGNGGGFTTSSTKGVNGRMTYTYPLVHD